MKHSEAIGDSGIVAASIIFLHDRLNQLVLSKKRNRAIYHNESLC